MTFVWWWLRPALARVRFWGVGLLAAAVVPATAFGTMSPWIAGASSGALAGSGVAVLRPRGGRWAGDLLLFSALMTLLVRVFWHVGPVVSTAYAVVVLTVTGLGIKTLAGHRTGAPAEGR